MKSISMVFDNCSNAKLQVSKLNDLGKLALNQQTYIFTPNLANTLTRHCFGLVIDAKLSSITKKVPVVERAGIRDGSIAKAEPLRRNKCGRDDCFPCKTGGGNCERNGAGYRIVCVQCTEEVAYEGETGSNGYSRGKEHQNALVLKQEENALWKHCLVAHAGVRVDFSMEVVGNFHSYLVRQVNEGVRIKRSKAELMNSKAEFHQHPVVRVVPTRGLQNEPGELAGGVVEEDRGR